MAEVHLWIKYDACCDWGGRRVGGESEVSGEDDGDERETRRTRDEGEMFGRDKDILVIHQEIVSKWFLFFFSSLQLYSYTPHFQVYTFDLISFDESDVIGNFSATVVNSTVFVEVDNPIYTVGKGRKEVEVGKKFQKYNVYIRDESNNQTVKHEIDVEVGGTKFQFPFQLDQNNR